ARHRPLALGPHARAGNRTSACRPDHRCAPDRRSGAVSRRALPHLISQARSPKHGGVKTHQVIIVGGGPVGIALALILSMRGIRCALVEARTGLHNIPKGQNLTQRTLEHFYFWGIADELRRARVMPPDAPIGEITAYGNLLSDYWHAPRGRELVRPYYFQNNDRIPQYRMEQVLRAKLAE